MRKFRRSITATLLAVILATQSAFVYADDIAVSNDDASVIVNEISDLDVSSDDTGAIVTDVSGDDKDVISDDISSNDQDETDEDSVVVPTEDESSDEEGIALDVSENDSEDVSDNDVSSNEVETWYKVPEGYTVSAMDMEMKADMPNTIESLASAIEGLNYEADRVFTFVDDEEEAEIIAEAYSSDIVSIQEGVLLLDLPEGVSVVEAVKVGADMSLGMPVVFPNFYRFATDYDVDDEEYIEETDEVYDSVSGDDYEESDEFTGEDDVYELVASNVYTDAYLNGNNTMYQWQHDVIGSAYAWKNGYTGSGVKVAVLDTGIVSSHSDLSVTGYYNYTANDTYDHNGHGSHCAGIIGARANNSLGVGVAPNSTIYGIKVLADNGGGNDAGIIAGMKKAVELGVDVMSMSLGGYNYSTAYNSVLKSAYNAGIVVVVAAGNDGGKEYDYPGSYDHVICVAATDKNNLRANFSNYSSKVDISAPGVDIPSVGISSTSAYVKMSGTSMATPVVSGAIAVLLSASNNIPSLKGKTGHYRVDAVEKLIKSTAKKCGSGMGKGIINLPKALGISTDISAPAKPVITAVVSADKRTATVTIASKSNNRIYYSTNGKTPTYKAGKLTNGTLYSGPINLNGTNAAKYTVKAIEVNAVGKASKYTYKKISLKSYVTSISVTGATAIAPGKYTTYKATAAPSFANVKTVTWSLSGAGVYPVPAGVSINSKTGKVTVKSSAAIGGQFYVVATAKDGSGVRGTFLVTIRKNNIKTLKFSSKSVSVDRKTSNVSIPLFVNYAKYTTVDGSTLSGSSFYWSSSNPSVASVDANGNVTCYKKGSAKITVKSKDTSAKSASITVKVTQLVTSASITAPSKLAVGTSTTMKAVVNPDNASNKKVKWSVEGTGVKIDSKGKLTVGSSASGTIVVKATALGSENKAVVATKSITVLSAKISGFSLSSKTGYIFRNKGTFNSPTSTSFTITVNGAYGIDAASCVITNSAPGLANMTTSRSGNVYTISLSSTTASSGTAKIKIESTDGSKKSATFTLTIKEPVTAVNIAAKKSGVGHYVVQGKTLGLKANVVSQGKPSSTKVRWEMLPSSYSGVSVNSKGTVSAKSTAAARSETYVVKATATDGSGAYGLFEVTVITKTTYAYFPGLNSYTTYYLYTGDEYDLTVYYNGNTYYSPSKGGTYYASTYISSSNPGVVTAGGGGQTVTISANKKGKTTITMKTASGKSASVKLWVK